MTSFNLGDKTCQPKRRLAKDFLWEYVTDNNPGCAQPTLLVSINPRTLEKVNLAEAEGHISSSTFECTDSKNERSVVAAGLPSVEQLAELQNKPAHLNRNNDHATSDVIESSNLDYFSSSIIFILPIDIPPRFGKSRKTKRRKKLILPKKSAERLRRIERPGVQKLGFWTKLNLISNAIPVNINFIEGSNLLQALQGPTKHPPASRHIRCKLVTAFLISMTLYTGLRWPFKDQRVGAKGLHNEYTLFPGNKLFRSKIRRLNMNEVLQQPPNRISRDLAHTHSLTSLSVAKVSTKVSEANVLPWTSVGTLLTVADPAETRLKCNKLQEENMSQFGRIEEQRCGEESSNNQITMPADLHPPSRSFRQQASNTCLANENSRELISFCAPDIPLSNKNCEPTQSQSRTTNNESSMPAEKSGDEKRPLSIDFSANTVNNGTLTEMEKRKQLAENCRIIDSKDKLKSWPRTPSMVNPERWRHSPVIKCSRESCVFFDRLTKETATAHANDPTRACQLGTLSQLFRDNKYTCNLERSLEIPIQRDECSPKALKTSYVKYAGTRTRDTQNSAVQTPLKKEKYRPSSTNVNTERTPRSSSSAVEGECRLTRRGIESLKNACLVLEKELGGICRSPDARSEHGEDIQVSQVRADISHLQKKLLDLSHAQKKRAAVLDQAVRLVNQMSRIGSQSNTSHRIRGSSWTPEVDDISNGSKGSSRKPRLLSPHQMKSKGTSSHSDPEDVSALMNEHHKRLQMDEPQLYNHQREGPVVKCVTQQGQMDGRLASFRCLDIPKTRSSFPPAKSPIRSANSYIPNQAMKTQVNRSIFPRSLPPTQLKQPERRPITSSGYGQRRSFVSQSTNTSDESRNANQAIAMINEATDTFELIKQRIDSLQYRRQCLRKILQEVTDRKHRLFKREDFHQEKPALDRKQKELVERLKNVQREMEQLQQNIQRRRSPAL